MRTVIKRHARAPAGRISYLDGRYLRHARARVHIEDRGLQFADAVYEVFGVSGGHIYDEQEHLDRLERSLGELELAMPLARPALRLVLRELARRNRLRDGLIYLQVTRGAVRRDHAIPDPPPIPTMILTARNLDQSAAERRRLAGIRVITRPDDRWTRCDIKSTSLLPNILAKTAARRANAFEAWLIDRDGNVTEGASTSAWIVDGNGRAITRELSRAILPGVTRQVILAAASSAQLSIVERPFTEAEALGASEAFITAATLGAVPVVVINGRQIGDGQPGPVTQRIQDLYHRAATPDGTLETQ